MEKAYVDFAPQVSRIVFSNDKVARMDITALGSSQYGRSNNWNVSTARRTVTISFGVPVSFASREYTLTQDSVEVQVCTFTNLYLNDIVRIDRTSSVS